MKNAPSSKWLYVSMFLLLIVTNVFVLTGVALNRSGEPDTRMILSQRELSMSHYNYNRDNRGLSLVIEWKVNPEGKDNDPYFSRYSRMPEWFDKAKLEAVGFDTSPSDHYKISVPKDMFIVLELNGDAYQTYIREMENALEKARAFMEINAGNKEAEEKYNYRKKYFDSAKDTDTRLFAVDAGLDPKTLREKYPDRGKYAIAKAVVLQQFSYNDAKERRPFGYIQKLSISVLHLPYEYRKTFDELRRKRKSDETGLHKYEIEMAYGKRYEPYILSIK